MSEVMWRLLWIACTAMLVAYTSYLFFGSALSATVNPSDGNIIALDSISVGKHHLRGVIVIPSECHGVALNVRQTIPTLYHLEFQTWQEPYRDCPKGPKLHAFEIIVFAPSLGITFFASLDGKVLNVHVIETYLKMSLQ